MARKAKSPSPPSQEATSHMQRYWLPNDADWGGFINVRLDEDQKEAFGLWFASGDVNITNEIDDLLGQGMKVGLSYDEENECYICTFTGRLLDDFEHRYCSTSRAGTLPEVLALSVYKHTVLCGADYTDFLPKTGRKLSWG